MTVAEVMKGITINPNAAGEVTNDAIVFAIDTSETKDAEIYDYVVAQEHVSGVDASFSPDTTDSQYIRAGKSTTKTGTQAAYSITGDRYIGDPFQDFVLSHEMIYATGEKARIPYVKFNLINGKGEKGVGTVIVNSDGSGTAGTNSTFDVEIRKSGANPEEFQYEPKEDTAPASTTQTTKLNKTAEKEII